MSRKSPDRLTNLKDKIRSFVEKLSPKSERNPQDDQGPKKFKSGKLSRRDFLTLGGKVGEALLAGAIADNASRLGINESQRTEQLIQKKKEFDLQTKIDEIYAYRSKLGLTWNLWHEDVNQNEKEWGERTFTEINVDVPDNMRSYGFQGKTMIEKLLGERATLFVQAIRSENESVSFSFYNRLCNLSPLFRDMYPTTHHAVGVLLHELLGHGTDPIGFTDARLQIPFNVLVDIEHGKWRALSQAFSVPGEFFHHPGDGMLSTVKTPLSREIAQLIFYGYHEVSENEAINEEVRRIVAEVRSKLMIQGEIYFNKAFCAEMSELLFERIFTNPQNIDELHPELQSLYHHYMNDALKEIYAEMMRLALEPDQQFAPNNDLSTVQRNIEIVGGITEVLEAISGGPIDIAQLRNFLRHTAHIYADLHALEGITEELIAKHQSITDESVATSSAPQDRSEEDEERESTYSDKESLKNVLFNSFYSGDIMSSNAVVYLNPDERECLGLYVFWTQQLLMTYPPHNRQTQNDEDISSSTEGDSDIYQYALNQTFLDKLVTSLVERKHFTDTEINFFDEIQQRTNTIQTFLSQNEILEEATYEYLSQLGKDRLTDELTAFFYSGDLFKTGKTDYLTDEEKNVLSEYASYTKQVTDLYPDIIYHPNWDHPKLHAWDSDLVMSAVDPSFVSRLMTEIVENRHLLDSTENFITDLQSKVSILKDFLRVTGNFAAYPNSLHNNEESEQ